MAEQISFPAVGFLDDKMWVDRQNSPWTVKGIRGLKQERIMLCDSAGDVFLVGSPIPERPLTLVDRLLNRWLKAEYGYIERKGHWTLDEFKARVCDGLDRGRDFFEESKSIFEWKADVAAASSYREVIDALHPEHEQAAGT